MMDTDAINGIGFCQQLHHGFASMLNCGNLHFPSMSLTRGKPKSCAIASCTKRVIPDKFPSQWLQKLTLCVISIMHTIIQAILDVTPALCKLPL